MNAMLIRQIFLALTFSFVSATFISTTYLYAQTVLQVPGDSATIQGAIDQAVDGNTVLVAPGTYLENINFLGKAIRVQSTDGPEVTIIDGNSAGPVVSFITSEGSAAILEGFTLQHGWANYFPHYSGGGIDIERASPTIRKNVVTNNRACSSGGGISVYFGSPTIEENIIENNYRDGCTGGSPGGGIYVGGNSNTRILNNIIRANQWTSSGGGIGLNASGSTLIQENHIEGNSVQGTSPASRGGGISLFNNSTPIITQNLFLNNIADEGGGLNWSVPSGSSGPTVTNNTFVGNIARHDGQGSAI